MMHLSATHAGIAAWCFLAGCAGPEPSDGPGVAGVAASRGALLADVAPTTDGDLVAMGVAVAGAPSPPDYAAAGTMTRAPEYEPDPTPSPALTADAVADLAVRAGATELVVATASETDLNWVSDAPLTFDVRVSVTGTLRAGGRVVVERQRSLHHALCACALLHVRGGENYLLALRHADTGRYQVVDADPLLDGWGPVAAADDGRVLAALSSGIRVDLTGRVGDWRPR